MAKKKTRSGKTGATLTNYVNSDGENKRVINAYHKRGGEVELKAYPLTEQGARELAKAKGYSKDYGPITRSGKERWFYEVSVREKDKIKPETNSGIASFDKKTGKMTIWSLRMSLNVKSNTFVTF